MQRWVSIFMLFVLSLSGTELHEVLRFPLLWSHYSEHKAEDWDTSFLEFIEFHYSGSDSSDSDNHTDANLPFKPHECGTIFQYSEWKSVEWEIVPYSEPRLFGVLFHGSMNLPSGYSGAVWQPPQFS